MSHLAILPILVPLVAGALLLLLPRHDERLRQAIGLAAAATQLALAIAVLAGVADGAYLVYALGDWPAPFGIVLVADRLSAVMLLVTAVVAVAALLYATTVPRPGAHFQALFQFQLLGINGAFLTGDLFNLFVFFEVLLIAFYALLFQGLGAERVRAAVHAVVLNLIGSALFLFAVGTLYAATGTLNFADLARVVPALEPHVVPLARTGALLLLVVFALKAAVLPLGFWIPQAYAAAPAAAAALFAVLTKVGVYAMLRVYPLAFGDPAGELAGVAAAWVLPAALVTLAFGALGVLGSRTLRAAAGWLVVYSVGTLLVAVGLFSAAGYRAALYYTVHSTLAGAAMFLLVDLVARHRGLVCDRLDRAAPIGHAALLGSLYFVGALAVAGLPPLTGFTGKLLVLDAARESGVAGLTWSVLLAGTLVVIVALARVGSAVFWRTSDGPEVTDPLSRRAVASVVLLLGALVAMVAGGGVVTAFASSTARQLAEPASYVSAVIAPDVEGPAHRRPLE
jgi:multicomponent K+:H+ antiporter subunit D